MTLLQSFFFIVLSTQSSMSMRKLLNQLPKLPTFTKRQKCIKRISFYVFYFISRPLFSRQKHVEDTLINHGSSNVRYASRASAEKLTPLYPLCISNVQSTYICIYECT